MERKHKGKKPFREVQEEVARKKTPKEKDAKLCQLNSQQQRPAWQFEIIDFDGRWGWQHENGSAFWQSIFKELSQFESMTWNEIYPGLSAGKTPHHPIPLSDFVEKNPDVIKRLREIGQNDIDSLFSLRWSGKERIFGIREGRVLKILWYDPEHQIYPTARRERKSAR